MSALPTFIDCEGCQGHGTYWKPSLVFGAQPVLAKCCACDGTGKHLICTSCGAKLHYGRLGRACGCNAVALNLPLEQAA